MSRTYAMPFKRYFTLFRLWCYYYPASFTIFTCAKISKYNTNVYRCIATDATGVAVNETKNVTKLSNTKETSDSDLLPTALEGEHDLSEIPLDSFIENVRSSLFKGYANEYHFLAIHDVISDFEQHFKRDLSSRLQYLRRKDFKSELLDIMKRQISLSERMNKKFFEEEADEFFQQLVRQLVDKKITGQEVIKRTELNRLVRILERRYRNVDAIIHRRRRKITPSIYKSSENKNSISPCLITCYLNRHLKNDTERIAMRDTFPILISRLRKISRPLIYSIRPLEMIKLSAVFKSAIVDLKLELPEDLLDEVQAYYKELIEGQFGLSYDELETYCVILKFKTVNLNGIEPFPEILNLVESLVKSGIKLNRHHIRQILAVLSNEADLNALLTLLGKNQVINKDIFLPILSKKLEFSSRRKDVLSFTALLKTLDKFYNLKNISENKIMLPLLRGLLSCGFYSSAKRILTMPATIGPDPLDKLDDEQLQLVKKLDVIELHPNACVLSNLEPTSEMFDAFFCYLCDFSNSWNQIKDIFELSYQCHVLLLEKTIWHLLMNITVSNVNSEELKQLICDYTQNYTSSPFIQKQEFTILTDLFRKLGYEKLKDKFTFFEENIPRIVMVKQLLTVYDIK